MKYNLAFRYRIYPNKEQELLINKTFGCVRFVYNTILYIANKIYEETGKNKIITPASLKSENQFLKLKNLHNFKREMIMINHLSSQILHYYLISQ